MVNDRRKEVMYENFANEMRKFDYVFLYGNGSFTELVKKVFLECDLKYEGIVISENGISKENELKISDIDTDRDKTCFVITVGDYAYTDVVSAICKKGYYNLFFFSAQQKQGIRYMHADGEYLESSYSKANNEFIKKGGSSAYWEKRYKSGGDAGASAYNHLAQFKIDVINQFLDEYPDVTICYEWGFGDGALLDKIHFPAYVGAEVSETALQICRERYKKDDSKQFFEIDEMLEYISEHGKCDLSLSLDTLFNLVEDEVYEAYMERLFKYSEKYVCILSSDFDRPQVNHEKRRCFTKYVSKHFPEFQLIRKIKNKYPYDFTKPNETSLSDFYFYKRKE